MRLKDLHEKLEPWDQQNDWPHPVGYKKGVSLPYPPFTLLFEATHQRSQWKRNKTHSTRNEIEMIIVSLLK